jgi:hypothetical protein
VEWLYRQIVALNQMDRSLGCWTDSVTGEPAFLTTLAVCVTAVAALASWKVNNEPFSWVEGADSLRCCVAGLLHAGSAPCCFNR